MTTEERIQRIKLDLKILYESVNYYDKQIQAMLSYLEEIEEGINEPI